VSAGVAAFYNTSTGTVASNAIAPLTTAATGNTSGAFTLNSNRVTVAQAGTYVIQFQIQVNNANAAYALFVNATQVPGTTGVGNSTTIKEITAFSVLSLAAGSIVDIRNIGTTTDTLAGSIEGEQATNVMLLLQRMS